MSERNWRDRIGPKVVAFRVRDRLTGIKLDALEVGVDFVVGDKLMKSGSVVVKCPVALVDLDEAEPPPVCPGCGEPSQHVLLWYGPGSTAFVEEYQQIS